MCQIGQIFLNKMRPRATHNANINNTLFKLSVFAIYAINNNISLVSNHVIIQYTNIYYMTKYCLIDSKNNSNKIIDSTLRLNRIKYLFYGANNKDIFIGNIHNYVETLYINLLDNNYFIMCFNILVSITSSCIHVSYKYPFIADHKFSNRLMPEVFIYSHYKQTLLDFLNYKCKINVLHNSVISYATKFFNKDFKIINPKGVSRYILLAVKLYLNANLQVIYEVHIFAQRHINSQLNIVQKFIYTIANNKNDFNIWSIYNKFICFKFLIILNRMCNLSVNINHIRHCTKIIGFLFCLTLFLKYIPQSDKESSLFKDIIINISFSYIIFESKYICYPCAQLKFLSYDFWTPSRGTLSHTNNIAYIKIYFRNIYIAARNIFSELIPKSNKYIDFVTNTAYCVTFKVIIILICIYLLSNNLTNIFVTSMVTLFQINSHISFYNVLCYNMYSASYMSKNDSVITYLKYITQIVIYFIHSVTSASTYIKWTNFNAIIT